MPVTVVVGAQFGSEGKGKVALLLTERHCADAVVRIGGSNSGHTGYAADGQKHILRHLPTAAILPDVMCVLGPGSYIDAEALGRDMDETGLDGSRLAIDPQAIVIGNDNKSSECDAELGQRIGSTESGTGAAVLDRISRKDEVQWARDHPYVGYFVRPTLPLLRTILSAGKRVIIEGTQGFGLSNLHTRHYPYATSRDTTASAFVAEAGLSPVDVDSVVLVVRSFPIRVGGNSGPLRFETDWELVGDLCGKPGLCEYSSVTQSIRRVGHFDSSVVRDAIHTNAPTEMVLNHADYFAPEGHNVECERRINNLERQIRRNFDWLGFSPSKLQSRADFRAQVRAA